MNIPNNAAAASLSLLAQHFLEHPATGPTPGGSTTPTSRPPVNLNVVDHITATVREIADYTRQVTPDAGPLPDDVADTYRWMIEHTAAAPETVQRRRDTLVHRQYLEHALAMGDRSVIPPHRCPACRCFGLRWSAAARKALCTNRRCRTEDGTSRMWTLSQLAHEHIQGLVKPAHREAT